MVIQMRLKMLQIGHFKLAAAIHIQKAAWEDFQVRSSGTFKLLAAIRCAIRKEAAAKHRH